MSHFASVQTKFTDPDAIVAALKDAGFTDAQISVGPGQRLRGYFGGYEEGRTADIAVRARHAEEGLAGYADIGFLKGEDGSYSLVADDYDLDHARWEYGLEWNRGLGKRFNQRYAFRVVEKQAKQKGFVITKVEEMQDGSMRVLAAQAGQAPRVSFGFGGGR
jgi:hypothetical protein